MVVVVESVCALDDVTYIDQLIMQRIDVFEKVGDCRDLESLWLPFGTAAFILV